MEYEFPSTLNEESIETTSTYETNLSVSDLGEADEYTASLETNKPAKVDTIAKRFIKNLMDSGAHIHIQYKNRKTDGSPYIWVTTSRNEGGSSINATKQNKTWLMNYITNGEVGVIPGEEGQEKFTGHKDLAKDFLILYLTGEKKKNLKFFPLFTTGDEVKAIYRFPYGRIIFNVPQDDKLINLMKEKEYIF